MHTFSLSTLPLLGSSLSWPPHRSCCCRVQGYYEAKFEPKVEGVSAAPICACDDMAHAVPSVTSMQHNTDSVLYSPFAGTDGVHSSIIPSNILMESTITGVMAPGACDQDHIHESDQDHIYNPGCQSLKNLPAAVVICEAGEVGSIQVSPCNSYGHVSRHIWAY
jgi:hypothetical protein